MLGSGIRIMVSIRVWDLVIVLIFRWGQSDRGHFDIVPFNDNIISNVLSQAVYLPISSRLRMIT